MERSERKSSNLLVQGSILAIASLIVRLIGLVYRIPLVNILGNEGNGYYSAAYTVYSFLLIISSYGFPAAISKIVANRLSMHRYREANQIFKAGLVLGFLIGVVFTSILYFGAKEIALLMGLAGADVAIKGLAPALFIFSLMSVFRGYFQGMNTMMPTAISQVIEQVFNAIFSLVFATLLLQKGLQYGAAGSSLGTGTGALFALLFLVFIYYISRPMIQRSIEHDQHAIEGNMISFWKIILMTSVPMVLGTSAFHLTNLVDSSMFNHALSLHKYSEMQVRSLYGILEGKYKILITLPVSLASAMSTAVIPSITASMVRQDYKLLRSKIDLAIRTVLIITIPAAMGIFLLAKPILLLLFTDLTYIDVTVSILKLGTISIVLFALSTISIGILQGLDYLKLPIRHALISLFVKVVFNILLLFVLNTNLYGMVITNIIFAACSAYLNFRSVKKLAGIQINQYKTLMAPTMSALIMGGFILLGYKLLSLLSNSHAMVLVIIPFAMVVYGVCLIILKAFSKEELEQMPFGNKLTRFIRS